MADPMKSPDRDATDDLAKAKKAVTDEVGSRTCYWTLVEPSRRVCTLEVSPVCRCEQVAQAVLEAVNYPSELAALRRRVAEMEGTQRALVSRIAAANDLHAVFTIKDSQEFKAAASSPLPR